MAKNRMNPWLSGGLLLLGGAIGYAWKGTFLAFWIGGIVVFLIVGLTWAFIAARLGRDLRGRRE